MKVLACANMNTFWWPVSSKVSSSPRSSRGTGGGVGTVGNLHRGGDGDVVPTEDADNESSLLDVDVRSFKYGGNVSEIEKTNKHIKYQSIK